MYSISDDPDLDPDLSFDSPVLAGLLSYWRMTAGRRRMPSHKDIDPVNILPSLLPHILLIDVEHHPERRFRWRLIGTHITTALNRDRTGRYWDEIYDEEAYNSMRLRVEWVIENRVPLRSKGHTVTPAREIDVNEAVFMPLSDDGETVNKVMMGSVYTFRTRS